MKITKQMAISSVSIALLLSIAACGGSNPADKKAAGAGVKGGGGASASGSTALPASCKATKPVIGVSLPDLTNPYYIAMQKGFLETGAKQGFDVKMAIANDNDSTQLSQIDAFIQQKVCAVALNPVSSGPAAADVAALNKAGIPVFSVNVLVSQPDLEKQNASVVQFVGADQVAGGKVEAEQVLKDLGANAKIFVGIVGAPDSVTTNQRDAGFAEALKSNPNAKVGPTVAGKADPNLSLQVTLDMLQGNPNMNVIWADTGPSALGAIQAVKQLKLSGKVSIYGFCAADTALDNILYRGCAAQEPYDYARIVVENMATYLDGKPVPGTILRPLKTFVSGQTPPTGLLG